MSIEKQIVINKLLLPKEVILLVKSFLFREIKQIDPYDYRYHLLSNIPYKEYNPTNGLTYVYLDISNEKDYFITLHENQMCIQTLGYFILAPNTVYYLDEHLYFIE